MNYKILCGMSSFRRPMECIYQIYKFMNMNYDNYKMSVIVRGVNEDIYNNQILNSVQKFINDNRLIIRRDKNKNCLTNIIETFDVEEKFDYYAKIDDDDWYSLDYLNEINVAINKYPFCSGCWVDYKNIDVIKKNNTCAYSEKNCLGLCGGSLVVSDYMFEILNDIKNNLGNIKSVYKKYELDSEMDYSIRFERGMSEDRLIHSLIKYFDLYRNMPAISIKKPNLYSIYRIYDGVLPR